jgi:hypothetical protein
MTAASAIIQSSGEADVGAILTHEEVCPLKGRKAAS